MSKTTIGIQGGRGSFNEQAALTNLEQNGISNYVLDYLHTSENVLATLEKGSIDYGQFAIENSLGGKVAESFEAMKKYNFDKHFCEVARYAIKVAHTLMIAPEADFATIDTIVTHPQVLLQCKKTLERDYKHLQLKTCSDDLIDPAHVAELLGQRKLSKNIATLSNKLLAEINGLKIVAENLQDSDNNYTTFILMQKKFLENPVVA